MMGNYHVRFLRGKGAVTRPTYLAQKYANIKSIFPGCPQLDQ
jgi:hypothetical protein